MNDYKNELKRQRPPLLIAEPCGAEIREQVFEIARLLSKTGLVSLFQCGVWKPRSSPNSFEGFGEKALAWLKDIENQYKLPRKQRLKVWVKKNYLLYSEISIRSKLFNNFAPAKFILYLAVLDAC